MPTTNFLCFTYAIFSPFFWLHFGLTISYVLWPGLCFYGTSIPTSPRLLRKCTARIAASVMLKTKRKHVMEWNEVECFQRHSK